MKPTLASLLLLAICACSRNIQTSEAVRDGVLAHLKSRGDIDLSQMTVQVGSVNFRKGEAEATVTFQAKGSTDPSGIMSIQYTLESRDGRWVVKGRRSSAAGDPHGAPPSTPALPPGHPPTTPGARP